MRLAVPLAVIIVGLLFVPPLSLSSGAGGPAPRASEPNNDMANATSISPGIEILDDLNVSGDASDWFALNVEKGMVLNASLYALDWPALDASLEVYDDRGVRQGYSLSPYRYETVLIVATWTSDYYIRVFVQKGGGAGGYRLAANIEQPIAARAGGVYEGAVRNDTDHPSDIYSVTLKAGDLISAHLSESPLPPQTDVSLDLWLMDVWPGSGLYTYLDVSWWGDPSENVSGRAPHDGTYYLIVTAFYGAGHYKLDLTVAAGPTGGDDFPPQGRNVFARASFDDSVDQAMDHYDCYRLNVTSPSGGDLSVRTTFSSGWTSGIFELFLLDGASQVLESWTNFIVGTPNYTADRIDLGRDLPGPGTYYIVLMAKWGTRHGDADNLTDAPAAANYSISINMQRNDDQPPFVENPLLVLGTDEDMPYGGIRLDRLFSDPDLSRGDYLEFSGRGFGHLNVSVAGAEATIYPAPGWAGTEQVAFRATDSAGGFCESRVPVTVSPVNHPPFIASQPGDLPFTEGSSYLYFLDLRKVFSDPDIADGDHLAFSVSPSGLSLYIEPPGFLSSGPVTAHPGLYIIIIRAEDRGGVVVEAYMNISVLGIPHSPVPVAPVVRMEMDEDTTGTGPNVYDLFSDPDGGALTVLISNAGNLSVTIGDGGWLSVIPEPDWSGTEEVYLEAWNIGNLSAHLTLMVTVRPVDDPPRVLSFYPPGNISVASGSDMVLRITATDVETPRNLSYRWTIDGEPAAASSSLGNALSLKKVPAGNHLVTVTVSDPQGLSASQTWAVSVAGKAAAPAVNATTVSNAGGAAVAVGLASWLVVMLAATEHGKYAFFKFLVVPLYSKIQKEEVLDHFTRGRIYGMIESNPGVHYTLIKKKVGVGNGTLTYHLGTLEREGFIRSEWDGLYKRFYPAQMSRTGDEVLELSGVQSELMGHIRTDPGISQKELSQRTGFSKRVISYHISRMAEARLIRIERDGKRMRCFALDGAS